MNTYTELKTMPETLIRAFTEKLFIENNVARDFPESIKKLKKNDLKPIKCKKRLDLRDVECFTIDCDDTKDMDDAVSLEKTTFGYRIGVHIADVAAYIKLGSELDELAMKRGYSIYLPLETIPMLPSLLSNDLCSLNPNVDRLAISVLINVDDFINVLDFKIVKSVIRSRIKGSYSEVNKILDGTAEKTIKDKYRRVQNLLFEMKYLAEKLRLDRILHGVECSEETDNKILVDGWVITIAPKVKGDAEQIIEEFIVLANRLVAKYFVNRSLPVVFRSQLEKGKVAIYTTEECPHAELNLLHYVHFTSPIRRLADLKIHQILTLHLDGMPTETIHSLLDEHLEEAADRAKRSKGRADNVMKATRNYCFRLWAEMQPQKEYSAKFVGFDNKRLPIFEILPYHVRATGNAKFRGTVGDMMSCKLSTSPKDNRLRVINITVNYSVNTL